MDDEDGDDLLETLLSDMLELLRLVTELELETVDGELLLLDELELELLGINSSVIG